MGGMEERPAPARGDVVAGPVLLLVAGVVVLAALEVEQQVGTRGPDDLPLEVLEVAVGVDLGLVAPAPHLLGHAQDDAVARLEAVLRHFGEVVELGLVDEGAELDVDAPEPPPVGEVEGEVAPTLPRLPPADPATAAEDAREVDEPVVPVVAAGA